MQQLLLQLSLPPHRPPVQVAAVAAFSSTPSAHGTATDSAAMAQPSWTQADPVKPSVSARTPLFWERGAHSRATHRTSALNGNNHSKLYLGLGDLTKLKVDVITIYFITNDEY